MAMNFMGLGFTFGAEDKGFGKQVTGANKAFETMQKSIAGIGMVAAKALKMPSLAPAMSLVQTMSNDTKITTTQLEAFGVQAHKVTSAGLAGLNMTTKEFKKAKGEVSSVAFAMNMDIGTVTQSMVALKQSGVDVTKIGFKSFSQFQKFMSVTGADATEFAANVARMRNQFGMTDDQIKEMITTTAAMGKKLNMGKQAVSGMSETIKIMTTEGAQFFAEWSDKEINRYVQGTTRIAGAMLKMGMTADEAQKASQDLTRSMIKGRAGMAEMFSGLQTDMPEAMESLTQHFGSVDQAFEMLKSSPEEFIAKMSKVSKNVQDVAYQQTKSMSQFAGMTDEQLKNNEEFNAALATNTRKMTDRFTAQMSSAFGPEVANLINKGYGTMEEVIASTQGEMKGGETVIDSYASKYSDGRTMAERFAIAEDRLYTRLKKVHGVMSDTEFLKEYQKQTTTLYQTMDGLAKKGGPVGKATQMMIEFANFGVGVVLGKMIEPPDIGLALGALIKKFGPLMTYLPGITAAFKALMSPITLVAAAIAGLYFVIKDLQKGADSIIRPWIEKFKQQLPELLGMIGTFITTAFEAVVNAIIFIFDNVPWEKVGETIGKGLQKAFELALVLLVKAVDLTMRLLKWFVNIDWAAVGKKVGGLLADAFVIALKLAGEVIMRLPELVYKAVVGAFKLVMGLIDGIVAKLSERFPYLAGLFKIIGMSLKGIAAVLMGYVVVSLAATLASAIATAVGWIAAWAPIILTIAAIGLALYGIYKAFEYIIKGVKWLVGKIVDGFKWLVGALKGAAKAVWDVISWPFRKLAGLAKSVVGGIKSLVGGIGSAIGGAISSVGSAIGGLFGGGGSLLANEKVKKMLDEMKAKQEGYASAADKAAKMAEEAAERARQAAIKRTAAQIKSVQELNQTADKEVKAAAQAMIDSGQKVVTTTGKIVDANKALVQWSRDAAGNVSKVAYELSEMQRAEVSFEPMKAGVAKMEEFRKATAAARASGEDLGKVLDSYQEQFRDFKKEYGVTPQIAAQWTEIIKDQFAVHDTLIQKVEGVSKSYGEALRMRQNQMADAMAQEIFAIEKRHQAEVDMIRERTKFDRKERKKQMAEAQAIYNEEIALAQEKWEPFRQQIKESGEIVSGELSFLMNNFKAGSEEQMQFAERAALAWANATKAKGKEAMEALAGANEDVKRRVEEVYGKIASAREAELKAFLRDTELRGPALEFELLKIQSKYDNMTNTVAENIKKSNNNLLAGTTEGFDRLNKEMLDKLDETGDKLKTKSKAMAGAIEKEYGVSGDKAVEMVQQIATINPKKFERNMQRVTASYKEFLKMVDKEGEKLIKNTAENINKFWEATKKGWDDQKKLLEEFGTALENALQRQWRKIAEKSKQGSLALLLIVGDMVASIRDIAGRINLLDVLSPESKIKEWARNVTLALAQAFMGRNVFDAAVGSFSAKTLDLLAELEAKKGTIEPASAAGEMRRAQTASELSRLVDAVHNPRWADDGEIPANLREQTAYLKELLILIAKQKGLKTPEIDELLSKGTAEGTIGLRG